MSRGRGTLWRVAALSTLCAFGIVGRAHAQVADRPPNIVVILTDDQRWDALDATIMPRLSARLVEGHNAVYLRNAFVSNPVCCPSRVSILTGRYSSSTGVYNNTGSFTGPGGTGGGGFSSFDDDPSVNPTIATDLHAAGYATAMIGKYLNKFNPKTMYTYVAPGWDTWFATKNGAYHRYYVADGTSATFYPGGRANYSSVVFADRAVSFIDDQAAADTPFFLYLSTTAPHGPARPLKSDVGRLPTSSRTTNSRPPSASPTCRTSPSASSSRRGTRPDRRPRTRSTKRSSKRSTASTNS
jgi:N-acetylglucosamine-6-sulfatase